MRTGLGTAYGLSPVKGWCVSSDISSPVAGAKAVPARSTGLDERDPPSGEGATRHLVAVGLGCG
jgi:hypothetical protein